MPQSYRLRTQLGVDQQIQVQLDQDFDFLELLSLKITQSDVYSRLCSDYGVIVGRVIANGGYGVPNVKVSVFVPLDEADELNPVISTLYPYKQPTDLNEDGYRYNLLPYQPQYDGHTPTGTFPSITDVLDNQTVIEVYEKYYKYTVKTNDSGDYMIFGVPTGNQIVVLDMDLSDIGPFSFSPQDLIRIGKATEQQINGATFKSSTNLNELPQIVNINTPINVNPFWGDEDFCQARIERLDFDLRELGYEFTPTAVFMGSIFSTPDEDRLRTNCKPKDNMGNLCSLTTGPGSILAIRQTIQSDVDGRPVLEEYSLENNGKIIDDNGTWMADVPMNLDYVVTNEFGEQIISNDPSIGIPTKGKYRFKVKWDQPGDLQEQVKRAYFLVPNIKEHWANSLTDPSYDATEDYVFTCSAQESKGKYTFPVGQNIYVKTFAKATSITISNQQNIKLTNIGGIQVPTINVFTGTSAGVFTLVSQNQLPYTVDVKDNEKIRIEIVRKNASQSAKVSYVETKINGTEDSSVISTNNLSGKLVLKNKLNVESFEVYINNVLYTGDNEEVSVLNGQTVKIVSKGIEKDSLSRLTYEFQTIAFAALQESYAFSLNWNDYYDIQDAIDCKDTFYEMRYNKVYSVSSLIDNYQKGTDFGGINILSTYFNRGRFIGIKEIDSRECDDTVNKFPVNDGVQNFDLLYFVVSILLQLLQVTGSIILFSYHILAFLWNNFAIPLVIALIAYFGYQAFVDIKAGIAAISSSAGGGFANFIMSVPFFLSAAGNIATGTALGVILFRLRNQKIPPIKLPMMTYPNCEACDCGDSSADGGQVISLGATCLVQTQIPNFELGDFPPNLIKGQYPDDEDDYDTENGILKLVTSQALVGVVGIKQKERIPGYFRVGAFGAFGLQLPLSERFNKFNFKSTYYTNTYTTPSNQMKVTIEPNLNSDFYLDHSLTIVTNDGCGYSPGDLITFVGFNNSKDPNPFSGETNFAGTLSITGTSLTPNIINVTYANDKNYNNNITKQFNLPTGPTSPYSAITRTQIVGTGLSATTYSYPADVEYFQVVDVLTVGEIRQQFCGSGIPYSISEILQSQMTVGYYRKGNNKPLDSNDKIGQINFSYGTVPDGSGGVQPAPNNIQTQPTLFDGFDDYQVVILQRGVDPYSPVFDIQYDVSSIYGATSGSRIVRGGYRINQPILNLNGNGPLTIKHNSLSTNISTDRGISLFNTSNFFQPGSQFTGFTTNAHRYYSSLDSTNLSFKPFNPGLNLGSFIINNSNKLSSNTSVNLYYSGGFSANSNRHRYYSSSADIIDGGSYMFVDEDYKYDGKTPGDFEDEADEEMYFSPMYNENTDIDFDVIGKNNIIMRSDRMPTSDVLQVNGGNSYQLHQNQNFAIYNLSNPSAGASAPGFGTGASQGNINEDGNFLSGVSQSFECRDMVSLNCYQYVNDGLTVIDNCDGGSVDGGCYVFVRKPLTDLGKDIKYFSEWGYRFKFFYGLCRGVLSQTFSNNWVNGTLYAFPFQLNVYYSGINATNANVAQRVYCKDNIVLHSESNNFYYRSSPYNDNNNKFIGASVDNSYDPLNQSQLLYPTTIIDLGPRSSFIRDLVLNPEYDGYNMTNIPSTSYGDTSDLVNFFTYTRITNPEILKKIIKIRNSGVKILFDNRKNGNKELGRVDGDLAQMMSINSEIGVIKYNSQFYQSTGGANQPVIYNNANGVFGVFFSSTTIDLQVKDYITPGKTNFRGSNGLLLAENQFTINSQVVPFYQWGLKSGNTIFGKPENNWETNRVDILQNIKYQGLNRDNVPYFQGETQSTLPYPKNDLYERGYLFNYKNNSYEPNVFPNMSTRFLVGAPFHFYFGIVKGSSAMDRFVKKYVR